MKINKIKATFECHKDSEIELADGLTVICGVNDSGKSSLGRSLRWVTTNTPTGASFLPWTGEPAEVTLTTEDGKTIIRTKAAKKVNKYTVDGMSLEAVNKEVPDLVSETLKVTDLNIQKQVDQYYILGKSPGDIAKLINEVAGISESDDAIRIAAQIARDAKKEAKIAGELRRGHQDRATQLSWTVEAKQKMERLESLGEESLLKEERIKESGNLRMELKEIDLERYEFLENCHPEKLDKLKAEADQKKADCDMAINLAKELSEMKLAQFAFLDDCDDISWMDELESKLLVKREALTDLLSMQAQIKSIDQSKYDWLDDAQVAELEKLSTAVDMLIVKDEELEAMKKQILEAAASIKEAEAEVIKIEEEIAKFPVCKECGQVIGGEECDH